MRRRLYSLWLAAALCLTLLAGCGGEAAEDPDGLKLWFTNDPANWSASATTFGTWEYQGEATVSGLLTALLAGPPPESGLTTAIPDGTNLLNWTLENRILKVDLSRPYGDLVGVDLTLADYCIVLTLTQLDGVEGVRITVNGSELPYRDRQVFYAEDVVLSGAEEEPVDVFAALYFRRGDGSELGFEQRIFRLTESESPTLAVLQALVDGPEDEGLTRLLPEELEIYSAKVDDGVCHVDVSSLLLDTVPAQKTEQELVISSIVNTLCSLDTVESVQLLVEGEQVAWYGTVDISQPLRPADGMEG